MARDGYPKRESHFAHKFGRLLLRTCAAQEIGPTACYLLVQIALTEDAAHYRRAVTFWNVQLESVLGLSKKQLLAVRRQAVDAGWLHYEPGGKGRVGRYWVLVPPVHADLPDHPIDEDFLDLSVPLEAPQQAPTYGGIGDAEGTETGPKGGPKRDQNGTTTGPLSNLRPSPKPKETFDPTEVDLPFDSERFRQSWGDFCRYRRELPDAAKAPLTGLAVTRLLAKCKRWGEGGAIASINTTIESGKWTGLFKQKGNNESKPDPYSGSDRRLA